MAEGATGPVGQISQTLVETIESQTLRIETLEGEVTDLAAELLDLEGSVGSVESTVDTLGGNVTGPTR